MFINSCEKSLCLKTVVEGSAVMVGGTIALLCALHRREWDAFIRQHQPFQQYEELTYKMHLC